MRKRKKKDVNPLMAVALVVAGAGFAGNTFLGLSGDAPVETGGAIEIVEDPGRSTQASAEEGVLAVKWRDLLAAHGSFDRQTPVRTAFAVLEEARIAMAAPAGETGSAATYWEGEDPPELELGVVMISQKSRRVVLGGRVIGLGEEQAGVVIQSIERDRVVTLWGRKVLTYDLQDGIPREFRAEHARRQREKAEGEIESAPAAAAAIATNPEDASIPDPGRPAPAQTQNTKGQEKGK